MQHREISLNYHAAELTFRSTSNTENLEDSILLSHVVPLVLYRKGILEIFPSSSFELYGFRVPNASLLPA